MEWGTGYSSRNECHLPPDGIGHSCSSVHHKGSLCFRVCLSSNKAVLGTETVKNNKVWEVSQIPLWIHRLTSSCQVQCDVNYRRLNEKFLGTLDLSSISMPISSPAFLTFRIKVGVSKPFEYNPLASTQKAIYGKLPSFLEGCCWIMSWEEWIICGNHLSRDANL